MSAMGRLLPVGVGAAKRPFADMRSLSIVGFRRTLGTAAPGQEQPVKHGAQFALNRTLAAKMTSPDHLVRAQQDGLREWSVQGL
jgi:hypothetical protein